jgi:hypothetical protein
MYRSRIRGVILSGHFAVSLPHIDIYSFYEKGFISSIALESSGYSISAAK